MAAPDAVYLGTEMSRARSRLNNRPSQMPELSTRQLDTRDARGPPWRAPPGPSHCLSMCSSSSFHDPWEHQWFESVAEKVARNQGRASPSPFQSSRRDACDIAAAEERRAERTARNRALRWREPRLTES